MSNQSPRKTPKKWTDTRAYAERERSDFPDKAQK